MVSSNGIELVDDPSNLTKLRKATLKGACNRISIVVESC